MYFSLSEALLTGHGKTQPTEVLAVNQHTPEALCGAPVKIFFFL